METIIPEKETIEQLNRLKLKDLFPKSIDNLDQAKEENKKSSLTDKEGTKKGNDSHEVMKEDKYINGKKKEYRLEKFDTSIIKFNNSISEINSITSYNNILLISSKNELKLYDISENFALYGTFKTPGTNKNILCLAVCELNDVLYCVIGGEFASLHVIDILGVQELTGHQLIGHKNKVYQLAFHPQNKSLLLSASKDCTVRLWNFKLPELLVIFGGPQSFESDVLCIDWNSTGDQFVGSGVDCMVRIYKIDQLIKNHIDSSLNQKGVKTLLKSMPFFKCSDVHDNLIDCIKFNNKFIISKSVDGIIKEWLPFQDCNGFNSFFLINIFVFKTKQLILGIKFFFKNDFIVVGNELGQIFLFNKEKTELSEEVSNHYFFQNNPTQIIDNRPKEILLRQIEYNSFYNIFFFGGNNGEIYLYKLKEING